MSEEQLLLVLAFAAVIALAVVALTAVALAVAVIRLVREVRAVVRAAEENMRLVSELLPPALNDLRVTTGNLSRLSSELEPRLERVDGLLDEGERTLLALRATAEAGEELVRGPAAAVDRARRTVRAAGEGIIRGADRLRRNVEDVTVRRDRD